MKFQLQFKRIRFFLDKQKTDLHIAHGLKLFNSSIKDITKVFVILPFGKTSLVMKKVCWLLVGGIMALALAVSCGDANRTYVRKAIRIMDRDGLFAEGADWDAARQKALAASPASLEEAQEVIREAGNVAGGKHTFLKLSDAVSEDAAATDWAMPSVTMEAGKVAVITLPPFSGNSEEGVRYASAVLDAVPDTVPGVVIDLRDNRGGNMYPMISAVHRFLADDDVLRFRTRKGTQWIQLPFVLQGTGVGRLPRIECPVAILTNEWTASSGEATLLCFRGLDYVRVFGRPTAGYASANQPFLLPDGAQLVLTIGCDVARTGEVFCDNPIAPDVLTDTPLEAALDWLHGQE